MRPGRYTDLFFLDEATALAAGHRPCAECQRGRFNLFREYWTKANPDITSEKRPSAASIDEVLHKERTELRNFCTSLSGLADGTFVTDNERDAYLVVSDGLLRWTPGGYEIVRDLNLIFPARILAPATVVRALNAGYPVDIHKTAVVN